jgi:hypothetical protein
MENQGRHQCLQQQQQRLSGLLLGEWYISSLAQCMQQQPHQELPHCFLHML